ncbi:MAG: ATP-binding cassette domain-containing protein [Desulfuromonadales bacterium]
MINVTNLSRRYGNFTAVDQVSFQIGCGEIVGLLGHNGAGKSTIMNMLTGFLEPSGGEIRIAGESLLADRCGAQARFRYIYVEKHN